MQSFVSYLNCDGCYRGVFGASRQSMDGHECHHATLMILTSARRLLAMALTLGRLEYCILEKHLYNAISLISSSRSGRNVGVSAAAVLILALLASTVPLGYFAVLHIRGRARHDHLIGHFLENQPVRGNKMTSLLLGLWPLLVRKERPAKKTERRGEKTKPPPSLLLAKISLLIPSFLVSTPRFIKQSFLQNVSRTSLRRTWLYLSLASIASRCHREERLANFVAASHT